MSDDLSQLDPWQRLQQWTSARIALGRAGGSMPTAALLDFRVDHALARDAISATLDITALQQGLHAAGFQSLVATSCASDRPSYLRRPDLGRMLDPASREALQRSDTAPGQRLSIVIADGLSALAPNTHAVALLSELRPRLTAWTLDTVVLATEARVALGDAIGEIRGAEAVLVLIGERPGLRSVDSLGAYLTYKPRAGRMDSERNCISNIRAEGLSYAAAAQRLASLLQQARLLGATGVALKEDSGAESSGTSLHAGPME